MRAGWILRAWGGLLLGAALALVPTAAAQPAAGQGSEVEAAAQAAFDEGMRLMEAGEYEQACVRLEQSLQLDRGMAAQFRLAECYEKLGKTVSAWHNYREVAQAAHAAGMADREKYARDRIQALQPRLPMLTIVVPEDVASTAGLQIARDGEPVARELWGKPAPVDPGTVRVEVTAPGKPAWSTEVVLDAEGRESVQVPPFGEDTVAPEGEADEGLSGQTIAGIVLSIAGLGGAVAGVAIGLEAKPRYDETTEGPDAPCTPEGYCTEEGLEIRDNVRTQGNIATAVFIVGTAMLVGGVVLWLTAPSGDGEDEEEGVAAADRSSPSVRVGLAPGGMVVHEAW